MNEGDRLCDIVSDKVVDDVCVDDAVEDQLRVCRDVTEGLMDGVRLWVDVDVSSGVGVLVNVEQDCVTEPVADIECESDGDLLQLTVFVSDESDSSLRVDVAERVTLQDAVPLQDLDLDTEHDVISENVQLREGVNEMLDVPDRLYVDVGTSVADCVALNVEHEADREDVDVEVHDRLRLREYDTDGVLLRENVCVGMQVSVVLSESEWDEVAEHVGALVREREAVELVLALNVCTWEQDVVHERVPVDVGDPDGVALTDTRTESERDCVCVAEVVPDTDGVKLSDSGDVLNDKVRDELMECVPVLEQVGDKVHVG